MKLLGKKSSALALAAASFALAGMGASSAQAAIDCTGSSIHGQGSSLQGKAQLSVWIPQFNAACAGTPAVTYTTQGSQPAMNTWRADGTSTFTASNHFIGTDDPPTATQISNINTGAGAVAGAGVQTIPVAQAAITVAVNLPSGCALTQITGTQLEQVFRGDITQWSGITGASGTCASNITRVVRADGSGTTYQFKHFLSKVNPAALACTGGTSQTWVQLQKATPNTQWPSCAGKSAIQLSQVGGVLGAGNGSGGGDEVKTIKSVAGGIGYASLSDARSQVGGQFKWLKVSNAGSSLTVEPSSNGVSATPANANCTTAANSYGATLPSVLASWEDVYLTTPGTGYPICTLTWDLAFKNYAITPWSGVSANLAKTVKTYLGNAVNTAAGTGQPGLAGFDYAVLPSYIQTVSAAAAGSITG